MSRSPSTTASSVALEEATDWIESTSTLGSPRNGALLEPGAAERSDREETQNLQPELVPK